MSPNKILLFFIICFTLGASIAQQPNYVFITIDDLNDYMEGFDGHPQVETPHISSIADHGTSFLRAYSSAPQCGPSRMSIVTGKDCLYTNVYHNSEYKCSSFRDNFTAAENNEEVFTIPQYLKDEGGYFTYSISKVFHCHKNLPDFDADEEDMCARELSWNKLISFGENGDEPIVFDYGIVNSIGVSGFEFCRIPDELETSMQDYLAVDSAIAFINDYADDPGQFCDKPFFLALGFRRPHGPLYIPEKYFLEYYNDSLGNDPFRIPYNNPPGTYPYNGVVMPPQPDDAWSDFYSLPEGGVAEAMAREHNVHANFLTYGLYMDLIGTLPVINPDLDDLERYKIVNESARADAVMAYLAAVKFVDAQIGRFMDSFADHPEILNNTIFVILGDHGYSLGEKTHWRKGALWETDNRAPLIISDYRTGATFNTTTIRQVSFLDLFPTIIELAGLDEPTFSNGDPYLDGYSLLPLLEDPKAAWSRPILSSYRNTISEEVEGSCFPQYSVRTDQYHYIKYRTNGGDTACDFAFSEVQEELYNIGEFYEYDPYEWNNIANEEESQAIIEIIDNYLPDSSQYLSYMNFSMEVDHNDSFLSSSIYPNPSNGSLLLSIQGQAGKAHISVVTVSGSSLWETVITLPADGYFQQFVQLRHLPSGYYLFRIVQEQGAANLIPIVIQAN